ncbi:MAG: AMP-binding protein, partial [Actinomycetota bacterium]
MAGWGDATTFAHAWSRAVSEHDHLTFLIFEGPEGHVAEWTYAEFDEVVGRMAVELAGHGVGEGHSVHLALTNSPTFIAVWLAANRLGAWIVPSDPMGRTPELQDHIERTTPTVGFCARDRADAYLPAIGDRPVFQIDEADVGFAWLPVA